jgi:hypothetical protein
MIYIAMYISGCNYPNEWRYLGAFSSEEKAEAWIQNCIDIDKQMNPKHPARYEQKRWAYTIYESEINEGTWS